MMLVPPQMPAKRELTAEEIEAMAATLSRVKAALADIVARECARPQGLIERGHLSRDGLDAATGSLGMLPVSDQEWRELRDGRGGTG